MRPTSIALLTAAVALLVPASAQAAPPWAPAGTATIHPGVRTRSATGECTANFVFYDASNNVYLGQLARCTAAAVGSTGCVSSSRPLHTNVTVDGATRPAKLVYSSWLAMQAAGETSPAACAYNDFALIRLDAADYSRVNPTVPCQGGPTGTGGTPARGDRVFGCGNAPALGPRPRTGVVAASDGWTHRVHWVPPGGAADVGGGVLDENGSALGATTSSVGVEALPGSSVVVDLRQALAYLAGHGGPAVTLALGTEPFEPLPPR